MSDDRRPPMDAATSESLLERVRRMDPEGWEELLRRYRGIVLGVAIHSGLSVADAEDVAQDVFACMHRHPPGPSPRPGSFRAWLYELIRWRIRDRRRAGMIPESVPIRGDDDTGTSPAEQVPAEDELGRIWDREWRLGMVEAALTRLSRKVAAQHFQIFELCDRQGWKPRRVASEMGVPLATVYVVRHRLGKLFRQEVERLEHQAATCA